VIPSLMPHAMSAAKSTSANRTTVDGLPCVFPASVGGRLYFDCVYWGGVLSCPTQVGHACQVIFLLMPDDTLPLRVRP
jgi:hypothetical protein